MHHYPRRVLVGIDATPGSRVALEVSIALCSASGGELHLVHVKRSDPMLRGRPPARAALDDIEREGQELLDRARSHAEASRPVSGTHLRTARRVDRALARLQHELGADLLVVGSGRASNTRRLERVVGATVRRARGSVLVARQPPRGGP